MTNTRRKLQEATATVERLRRELQLAELQELRAKLATSAEPAVGKVVRIDVQFRPGERAYTYVGLRTEDGWRLTGKRYEGKLLDYADLEDLAERNVGQPARIRVQRD